MSGSCPVSAHVCRETARERDELRRWKTEALPVLDGLQELGKALGLPPGSRITGPEALAAVERLTRERDEARAEIARLRSAADSLLRKSLERAARGQVPAVNVVEISEAFRERPTQPTEGDDRD